jgi:hypothetical protein
MMVEKIKFYFLLRVAQCVIASVLIDAVAHASGDEAALNRSNRPPAEAKAPVDPGKSTNVSNPAANRSNGTSFQAFRVITERNIFNQNRGPRSAQQRNDGPSRPAPKVHSLALVGTMSFAKGDFAFFDGTNPDYKKPVKIGEKIGEYQVKAISPSAVKVANEKEEFEIKVGQQLRREDEGPWQLAAGGVAQGEESSSAGTDGSKSESGSPSEDEALKRLMEKRAKEMNQ